ncbi:MAG: S-layer homology domain-containing protein [Oscillospiraceae bacterium]|nr:S-layer homology domain-containing protein [Oscillospiraceae bacterium]
MKKKITVILLALCITLSLSQTAFAADVKPAAPMVEEPDYSFSASSVKVDEKALEQAILTAKSRVNIPDEYKNFDFSSYVQYGANVFELHWSIESDSRYAYISVRISGNIITSYYANDSDKNSSKYRAPAHFAAMSNKELYNKAIDYAKNLNPDIYASVKIDENSFSSNINSTNCGFSISRVENGITVNANGGYITLNKNTGELLNYHFSWVDNASFKDPKDMLNQAKIKESYTKEIGLTPVYRVSTDYSKKTQTASLLYLPKSNEYLDAFTGKISRFNPNFHGEYAYNNMAEGEMAADVAATGGMGGDRGLTTAELAAVEKEKGLLTLEKAAEIIINDKYNAFTKNDEVYSAHLSQDYFNKDIYYWNIYFTNGSASVNAKTGEIKGFDVYSYEYSDKINASAVDSKITEALKFYMGSKFSEYKLEHAENLAYNERSYDGKAFQLIYGRYYVYTRYVNGIPVENDNIWVETNTEGLIRSFGYNYSDVKFPAVSSMLSEKAALDKLYEQVDLEFAYYINVSRNNRITTALLYTMPYFMLDAFTGSIVNYYGEKITPLSSANGNSGYSDIENHAIKDIAQKLSENGISLPAINGELRPDARISEADFINLVGNVSTDWEDFYYDYRMFIYEEKTSATISRRNAVKCFVTALGGKKFAELPGIFTSPFTDVKNDDKDLGYFMFAKSMGILPANTTAVNPGSSITRAQALQMIYGYLQFNTDNLKNS